MWHLHRAFLNFYLFYYQWSKEALICVELSTWSSTFNLFALVLFLLLQRNSIWNLEWIFLLEYLFVRPKICFLCARGLVHFNPFKYCSRSDNPLIYFEGGFDYFYATIISSPLASPHQGTTCRPLPSLPCSIAVRGLPRLNPFNKSCGKYNTLKVMLLSSMCLGAWSWIKTPTWPISLRHRFLL